MTSLLLTAVPDSTTVAYQLNRFFNTMVTHLEQVGGSIEGNFATEVAQGVAAVAVLFYLGWEMWPVIMGKRGPDITKLIRPILIAAIISGWPFFFLMFEGIKTSLADGGKQMYHSQQNSIMAAEKSMQLKIEKIDSIRRKDLITYLAANSNIDGLDKTSLESKEYAELRDDYIDSEIKEGRQNRFAAGMIEFANFLSTIVENILKWIGQIALQTFFCGILIVGDFGTIVLGMFGPVMFALSIVPAFRNHWAKWIEKYLCIALYPCLGYLCMAYVNWMILYYLEVQCNIGDTALSDWEKFVSVSYNHFGLIINYLVALFTGAYVMQAVPSLARNIFPGPSGHAAAGAGMFVSGMTMNIIGGAVKTAVTTGVGVATGMGIGAAAAANMSGKKAQHDADKAQKDAFSKKKKEDFDKLKNDHDRYGASNLDGSSSLKPTTAAGQGQTVSDGSRDQQGSKRSNSMDSYSKYSPYAPQKKNQGGDGESFEYKRTSGKKQSPYAPKQNGRYPRRGQYFQQDKLRYRFSPAKLRHYWGSGVGFLLNFVLADESNANPQAWAGVVGSIKRSSRSVYSLPWIFAKHYQKHQNNGTYKAINQWQKEKSSDMVFVRRPAVGGYAYQTFGEEAQNLAKLTGEKVRYVNVAGQKVATFTLNKHNLQPVIHRLNEMGISVNVISQKGRSIYYKENISYEKMDALENIKKQLKKLGGDIRFTTPKQGFHTEATGNGFNFDKEKALNIKGIMTDAYGALHITVQDENGKEQQLYLDRLSQEDLQKLDEWLATLNKDSEKIEIDNDVDEERKLDKINDEFGFSNNETAEYAGQSHVKKNGNDKLDNVDEKGEKKKAKEEEDDEGNEENEGQVQRNNTEVQETENERNGELERRKNKEKENKPKVIDPLHELQEQTAWLNTTPWGEWRKTISNAARMAGGGTLFLIQKVKLGKWLVNKGRSVSSVFGWNDKTKADVHKDIRAGLEFRWHFRMEVKENLDFRKNHRGLPFSYTLKRHKEQVIRRGRGINFQNVDFRKRTGFKLIAHNGWRFTKWSMKTTAKTGIYALGVATGQRPLLSISAVGTWGFKKSYNGIRWMARQTTTRKAVIAWKREDKHNYVIVNRNGIKGNRYQTYGEDAVAIARILHKERDLRMLHIGEGRNFRSGGYFDKNAVPSLTLTKDDIAKLKNILERRGLSMDVINTRGHSLLSKNNELSTTLGIHKTRISVVPNNPNDNVPEPKPNDQTNL